MFKKFVKAYYKLLDEKLEKGTAIVLIIAILIATIGFFTNPDKTSSFYKVNILENKQLNYIEIEGKKYKINIEKLN